MQKRTLAEQAIWDSYGDNEQDPPLIDWRKLRPRAQTIVERLAVAKKAARGNTRAKPVKLEVDEVAELLADLIEVYVVANDEYEARTGFDRPPPWGRKKKTKPPTQILEPDEAELLIRDASASYYKPIAEIFRDDFANKVGQPGGPRFRHPKKTKPLPPVRPLHPVYRIVRHWWRAKGLSQFTADFKDGDDEVAMNPPSRFLYLIFQSLNPKYRPAQLRNLHDTIRKKDRKQRRQNAHVAHEVALAALRPSRGLSSKASENSPEIRCLKEKE